MSDADKGLVAAVLAGDPAGVRIALAAGADPHLEVTGRPGQVYHDEVPVVVLAAWSGAAQSVTALLDAARGAARCICEVRGGWNQALCDLL